MPSVPIPTIVERTPRGERAWDLFSRMLQELVRYSLRVNAACHVVMALVTEHTYQLRSQGLVQDTDDCLAVSAVRSGDCAILNVLPRTLADPFNIGDERTL